MSSIDAGEIKVIIGGETYKLETAVKKAQGSLNQLGKTSSAVSKELGNMADALSGGAGAFGRIASAAGPAGLAIAAAVGGAAIAVGFLVSKLTEATKEFVDFGGKLSDLSEKTGVSTDALQKLAYAGSLVGVSMEDIASSVTTMQSKISSGDDVFERMGLSIKTLHKLSQEDAFLALASQIARIQSPMDQTSAAMESFGKAGATLLPLIRSDVRGAMEEAKRLGVVMSSESVKGADDLGDSVTKLSAIWDGFKRSVASALVESGSLQSIVDLLTDSVSGMISFVKQNKEQIAEFFRVAGIYAKGFLADVIAIGAVLARLVPSIPSISGIDRSVKVVDTLGTDLSKTGIGRQLKVDASSLTTEDKKTVKFQSSASAQAAKAAAEAAKKSQEAWKKAAEEAIKSWGKFYDITTGQWKQLAGFVAKTEHEMIGEMLLANKDARKRSAEGLLTEGIEAARRAASREIGGSGQLMSEISDEGLPTHFFSRDRKIQAELNRTQGHLFRIEDATEGTTKATFDWSAALQDVNNAFRLVGISADSTLGRIVGGLLGAMAAGQQAKKAIQDAGGFGKLSDNQKIGVAMGGLQTLASATKMGVGGGALAGASFGAQVGGPWGAAIGALAGGLAGLFGGSKWAGITRTAGKVLGVSVSEELAKKISATAGKIGTNTATAALLHITDAMNESGKDARSFGGQINSLMEAVKLGSVPAVEGLSQIGAGFSRVAEAAVKAASVGDKALVSLIKRARELNLNVPEIKEFVSGQLGNAAEGINRMVAGLSGPLAKPEITKKEAEYWKAEAKKAYEAAIASGEDQAKAEKAFQIRLKNIDAQASPMPTVTPEGLQAQATLFAATFWASVKDKGLVGAADALRPAFDILAERTKQLKIDVPGFEDIAALMKLSGNEQVRGASEGVAGAGQALTGLANAGFLTQGVLSATEQIASQALQQAISGGATQTQGLEIIAPLLSQLISASQNSGMALDETTQQLIQQAKDNGIAILQDPIQTQTRILGEIRDILKGSPGAGGSGYYGSAPADFRSGGGAGAAGIAKGEYNPTGGMSLPRFKTGGYVPAGVVTPAIIDGPEFMVPQSDVGSFIKEQGGIAGTSVNVAQAPMNFYITSNSPDETARRVSAVIRDNTGGVMTEIRRALGLA